MLIHIKLLRFHYKFTKNLLPDYLISTFKIMHQQETHNFNTRNRSYLTHKVKHEFAENSIRYQLPTILNKTPNNVLEKLETHSNIGYKLYIKNCLWEKYKTDCTVEDGYICQLNGTV